MQLSELIKSFSEKFEKMDSSQKLFYSIIILGVISLIFRFIFNLIIILLFGSFQNNNYNYNQNQIQNQINKYNNAEFYSDCNYQDNNKAIILKNNNQVISLTDIMSKSFKSKGYNLTLFYEPHFQGTSTILSGNVLQQMPCSDRPIRSLIAVPI
jgi:hypothetical protein